MQTLPVGEFKTKFSEIISKVKAGDTVGVSYGKNKKTVAVLLPYEDYKVKKKRKLGLLKDRATYKIKEDFKISEKELWTL